MSRRTPLIVLACLAAALAGCAQPALPQEQYYRLAVTHPERPLQTPLITGTLEVGRPAAQGVISQRALALLRVGQPDRLEQYHYHTWDAPPSALVEAQLATYLRLANLATRVVTPDLRTRPDYKIGGTLLRFEQVLGEGPPRAVVAIQLALLRTSDNALLLVSDYREEQPAVDDGPAAAVAALDAATSRVFARFVDEMSRVPDLAALGRSPPTSPAR